MGLNLNLNLLQTIISGLPYQVLDCLKDFRKYPTLSNEAYFVGYIRAKHECGCISDEEYNYLLALAGEIVRAERVRDMTLEALRSVPES